MNTSKFYFNENINRLACNEYINELLTNGRLKDAYEADRSECNSPKFIHQQYLDNRVAFVVQYQGLGFNDFLFLNNLDIQLSDIRVIMTLLRYGSGCRVYMDRAVLKWLLQGSPKEKNLQRNMKSLEMFTIATMESQNKPVYRYKRMEQAKKDGFIINEAFYHFTHNNFHNSFHDGIVIDLNFLLTDLAMRANTVYSKKLISIILDIFNAQTEYGEYILETSRFNAMRNLYNKLEPWPPQSCSSSILYEIKSGHKSSTKSTLDKIVSQAVNDDDDNDSDSDEGLGTSCVNESLSPLPSPDLSSDDSAEDEDEGEAVDRKKRKKSVAAAVGDDADFVMDDKFQISCYTISPTICFFSVTNAPIKDGKFLLSIQKIMVSSCNASNTKERFCVVMFYDENENVYKFLTRQVFTGKNVLIQHNHQIVCGWSGMIMNMKKNLLLAEFKKKFGKKYTIKSMQVSNVKDRDEFVNDLTQMIKNLELNTIENTNNRSLSSSPTPKLQKIIKPENISIQHQSIDNVEIVYLSSPDEAKKKKLPPIDVLFEAKNNIFNNDHDDDDMVEDNLKATKNKNNIFDDDEKMDVDNGEDSSSSDDNEDDNSNTGYTNKCLDVMEGNDSLENDLGFATPQYNPRIPSIGKNLELLKNMK